MRRLSLLTTPLALGPLGALAAPHGGIYSHLLGGPSGDQPSAFRVRGYHAGPVPMREHLHNGWLLHRAALASGEQVRLVRTAGSTALRRNTSQLLAVFDRDTSGCQPGRRPYELASAT